MYVNTIQLYLSILILIVRVLLKFCFTLPVSTHWYFVISPVHADIYFVDDVGLQNTCGHS